MKEGDKCILYFKKNYNWLGLNDERNREIREIHWPVGGHRQT